MTVLPTTMRAALAEAPGRPLRLVEAPVPTPGEGEVLLRVTASGINPLDLKILDGVAEHARQPLPAILGMDVTGVVAATGKGVTRLRPDDEVFGMAGGVGGHAGSLAEYMIADARLLARKPAALTQREATALPLVFITAWEGLVDRATVKVGQTVLVLGAGGVGQMALQIARARGATTFATGSPGARETVERLGAFFVEKDVAPVDIVGRHTGGEGFDIVFDTAGGAALDAAFAMVRRYGHVVSALGWGMHRLAPLSFRAASYSGVFALLPLLTGVGRGQHGQILAEAVNLVEAGRLRPTLHPERFTLDTVNDAYARQRNGTPLGKLVVEIAT